MTSDSLDTFLGYLVSNFAFVKTSATTSINPIAQLSSQANSYSEMGSVPTHPYSLVSANSFN
jgi:hypothetical protein